MAEKMAIDINSANKDEQKDTILEDMISFKLGQEVTISKILFDDSDEEFSNENVEEVFSSSDDHDRTSPCINNVIILGTKKSNIEVKTGKPEKERHATEIEAAKEAIEIPTSTKNKTVEIKTEIDEDVNNDVLIKTAFDGEKQKLTETNNRTKQKKKLGPNECVYIAVDNINELKLNTPSQVQCADPLSDIVPTISTTDDQPSEAKKLKRAGPRTKVTSRRNVKKFPGKMDAMRRHSADLNTSCSEKSAMPVTTTSTSLENNLNLANNNSSNANFHDPYVLPMLTTVVENLLVIFPSLYSYITARKTTSKLDETYKLIKNEFEALKFHCFCLSYATTLSLIVPNKADNKFMKEFYNFAEKLAILRQTPQFSISNFEILCGEMIEYTEHKQKKMALLLTNSREKIQSPKSSFQNKEESSEILKRLQATQKPLPQVPVTDSKIATAAPSRCKSSVVKFKTGPPGREIEIAYNSEQQPQIPTQNDMNNKSFKNYSTPASTPTVLHLNKPFNQPKSIANSNQNETRQATPLVASTALNLDNLFNHMPKCNNQKYLTNHVTAAADSNYNCTTNVPRNNNTGQISAANPPLNYMETFNTYIETRARDLNSYNVETNASNYINTAKPKHSRQSQKEKKALLCTADASLPSSTASQNNALQMRRNMANTPSNVCHQSTYSVPPPPYPSYQNQQYYPCYNYQMPQTHHPGNQKLTPLQQYSNPINPPAPIQERSSVSRDSGFMSPLDEIPLNMLDQLDSILNAAAETHNNNVTEFQAQEMGGTPVITHMPSVEPNAVGTPVITHVTSLDPKAVLLENGNCHVCGRNTKYRCLGCNDVYYCRYECQHYDWPRHRIFCKARI